MRMTKPDVTALGNLIGAEPMGVDPDGLNFLMGILSNMYSNPYLAVVREYASNALDSHAAAGNTDPILVTSPSHFTPNLVVQDFGIGLDLEGVKHTYAKYLRSTKRGCRGEVCDDGSCPDCKLADTQIGAFGIGSKSAFAAGSQFIVTAVKDGWMTMALFALDNEGAPTKNIIGHEETDEPNGVKVEVAVNDVDATISAIERLFRTWPKGSVMVDGVEPTSIWDSVEKMEDDIHIEFGEHDSSAEAWTIIMGGVPYTIPDAVTNALEYRQRTIVQNIQNSKAKVYLSVPISGVDVTPSREELRVTPRTIATVGAMVERFHLALGGWVTGEIANATSLLGAVIRASGLKAGLGNLAMRGSHTVTWNGKPLPTDPVQTIYPWFRLANKRRSSYYNPEKVARREADYRLVPNAQLHNILFVTNVPDNRVRTVQLAAKEYLSQQDKGSLDAIQLVVAVTQSAPSPGGWFTLADPALRTMSFDQFATFKPAPAARTSTSGAVKYNTASHGVQTAADLKGETTVYYLQSHEQGHYNMRSDLAVAALGNAPLIILKSSQKVEPLRKRLPQAAHFEPALIAHARKVLADVKQTDVDSLTAYNFTRDVDRQVMNFLLGERAKITSATVLGVMNAYVKAEHMLTDQAQRSRTNLITAACRVLGKSTADLGQSSWDARAFPRMMESLPLLTSFFLYNSRRTPLGHQHIVKYINMIGL